MNNNQFYSQSELLSQSFENTHKEVLQGLFKTGIYFLAGTSKIGKSLITTSLANAVSIGTLFLGKQTTQGKVIYFDNDNYAYEAKDRIIAQSFSDNDSLFYNFTDSNSLYDIKEFLLGVENLYEFNLVIIDCLANLEEFPDTDKFTDNYNTIKEFRDFLVTNGLCCILIHHTKKGRPNSQDSVLGSKSLTSAATGTVLIETEDEFSTRGKLRFILRSKKEIINIKKDENNINWILDENEDIDESIDKNTLFIINYLAKEDSHYMKDNCQTIVAKMNLDLNPSCLYRYLKRNKKLLNDNHIFFDRDRSGKERVIELKFSPE